MDISVDIGVVTYSITSKDSINASWYSTGLSGDRKGSGIAKGDTSNGFEGKYKIIYFSPNEAKIDEFDLEIVKVNEIFHIFWKKENKIVFVGVGIESDNTLSVGWRRQTNA